MPGPLLIAGGAALGALSFLDKKKQQAKEEEALRQEQEFNKAVAPTVGWTNQFKGPTDYSKVSNPSAVAEIGGGALGGAAMQQGMDNNDAYNALLQEKTKQMQLENAAMAPQAVAAESPQAMQPQGMVSPDLGVYLKPDGTRMGPKGRADWQALFSNMGNTRNG